jgi:hypothetical protein
MMVAGRGYIELAGDVSPRASLFDPLILVLEKKVG